MAGGRALASGRTGALAAFNTSTAGYVVQSVAWILGILVIFVPLAVRQFNKS